jgi:hypothetical protein
LILIYQKCLRLILNVPHLYRTSETHELFANLFGSVYDVGTCESDTENVSGTSSNGCGFSSIRLRMSDSEAAIFGLNANKESTVFLLPLLNSAGLKSHPLHILNLSLSISTFPSKWKASFCIPFSKTGKRNDVGNDRGVEIHSCFAKLFEVTVYDYIFLANIT